MKNVAKAGGGRKPKSYVCVQKAEAPETTTAVWRWWTLLLGVLRAHVADVAGREFVCAGGCNSTLRLLYTAVSVYAFNQSPTPLSTALPPRQSTSTRFAYPSSLLPPFLDRSPRSTLSSLFLLHTRSLSLSQYIYLFVPFFLFVSV